MATISIELLTSKKLKKQSDRHPIYIIVRHNDVARRKSVGAAFPDEWDDVNKRIKPKGRKDHVLANIQIEDEFDKYNAKFKELTRRAEAWRAEDVFEEITEVPAGPKSFIEIGEAYLESIKHKSSYPNARARLEKVRRYGGDKFMISDMDNKWISGFIRHCQTKEKNNKGEVGNTKNTINHAFRFIKTVIAYSDQENHFLRKHKLSYDRNIRSKLSAEEIELIKNLKLEKGTLAYHSRNIFLIQYYFRGMRIADALRLEASDFNNGRLAYDASKTGVQYDMKVVDAAAEILQEYMDGTGHYLFPFLRLVEGTVTKEKFFSEIKNRTMIVNKHLKVIAEKCGIQKRVTTHIARHSFASIADKQLGGDLKTLQGLFGHSSRKITEIYIRDLRKTDDLDDAADKILG